MPDPFRHQALPYRGHDEFVSSCVSVVNAASERDEFSLLLAAEPKLTDVRDALGTDSGQVTFVSTEDHGRNPARLTTLFDSFQAGAGGRRSVGVNESVFAGRSPAALHEALLAESVLNSATLQSWPMSVVCLYDCDELEPQTLEQMRRSHPLVQDNVNDDYEPGLAGTLFAAPLVEPAAPDVASRDFGPRSLADARAFVRTHAEKGGLAPDRLDDLVLAANEIVSNSLRHGEGHCRLSVWQEGDSVFCQARDAGCITDPLLGRLAPSTTAPAGRGLWLANHLCDLVQIRSSQAGTVVRLCVER